MHYNSVDSQTAGRRTVDRQIADRHRQIAGRQIGRQQREGRRGRESTLEHLGYIGYTYSGNSANIKNINENQIQSNSVNFNSSKV